MRQKIAFIYITIYPIFLQRNKGRKRGGISLILAFIYFSKIKEERYGRR